MTNSRARNQDKETIDKLKRDKRELESEIKGKIKEMDNMERTFAKTEKELEF